MTGALVIAWAGVALADRSLSLEEAIQLARVHNRDLRASRERIALADAGVAQARAALLPTVSIQGRYLHNYKEVRFDPTASQAPVLGLADAIAGSSGNPAEAAAIAQFERQNTAALASQAPIVIQKQEELDAAVNATVPLIAPSSLFALSAARRGRDATEENYRVSEAGVLVAVAEAYFAAAGSDELVVARRDAVAVASETHDVARARVAARLANQVESMRAETAVVRAEQDLAEAETARAAAYRALATIVGTTEPIAVRTGDALPAEPGEVDALLRDAAARRPELAAQRATIAMAEASAQASAWRWSPTLSAFGDARAQNYAGFSGDRYAWAVGLELDWVVFDGGLRDAQRRAAEAQLELATASVSDEVADAHDALATKRRGVGAAQRAVALARETLRLVRAQYDAGTAKQLDVLQAQDVLVATEVALAQAHFEVALADLQLRRATGEFPGRAS